MNWTTGTCGDNLVFMSQRFLITGGAGFIGSHLAGNSKRDSSGNSKRDSSVTPHSLRHSGQRLAIKMPAIGID
jgi:hypothetical protein